MSSIKHKFLVMSSKGGVGKTSVIVNLALALSMKGMKVGLMDLNYNSPEIHKLFGLELFSTGPGNRAVFLGFYIPHISLDLYQKEAMEAAEKFMDRVCEQQMKGCPNFERRIFSGDPAAEILKTIDSEAVDLVVMGTHGYKGLEQAIFGSVSKPACINI